MHRRQVLALLGTSVASAGCLSGDDEPTSARSPTSTAGSPSSAGSPTSTAAPEPLAVGEAHETASGWTVTVSACHLRRSVFELFVPDAVRPLAPASTQFVFLTVALHDSDSLVPEPGSFRLLVDDAAYRGSASVGGADLDMELSLPNDDVHLRPATAAESGNARATVGFEVPLDIDPEHVVVEWTGDGETARWAWDPSLVDALGRPPSFRVVDVSVPESFACGDPFDVSITVANDGGRPGEFLAVVPVVDPVFQEHPPTVTIDVPANGEATWDGTLQFPPEFGPGDCEGDMGEVAFELNWGTGMRRITVDTRE